MKKRENNRFQNLNVIVENCRNDLKKFAKTIEINQKTLQQYENVIKEQQTFIEELQRSQVRQDLNSFSSSISYF